ncbi:MAG: acylphosphatase [Chloroflexi bacterium]|nr:acylphosphatase [Chloroflexota bacterium]
MADQERLHAWIDGHVQGVGFRYFVRESAAALPVSGWVRNLHDGRVELLAEGRREDLDRLLSAVRRGPRGSHVMEVRVKWETANGEFDGFRVQPTA